MRATPWSFSCWNDFSITSYLKRIVEQSSQALYKSHIACGLALIHSTCSSSLQTELQITHANTPTGLSRFKSVILRYHYVIQKTSFLHITRQNFDVDKPISHLDYSLWHLFIQNIPLNIEKSMRRAKKCSSPMPTCLRWCNDVPLRRGCRYLILEADLLWKLILDCKLLLHKTKASVIKFERNASLTIYIFHSLSRKLKLLNICLCGVFIRGVSFCFVQKLFLRKNYFCAKQSLAWSDLNKTLHYSSI